ncbi:MAG: PAS domain-containing protein [Flavobacteriales bacterium]|nr:PAS domain-containing protein [Flavobacteriales bacterium]MCW8911865.1 PAS domain-containing protein [Flavobacteriales bacterium]MCW8936364.1 PAS domain-containing protein [Flavobacteriales bacterium]MCW8990007.1 PAS domain-containing protein [Flavobacteriales bacterium]MCW9018842.1 PAS domain-containing protein [Flavobacteriales bacterium]
MNTFLPVVDELSAGHPVKVYYEEAELIQNLIKELKATNLEEDFQKYFNIFNELSTIEKRFARKENQLFPYLEKHGWDGPSQGMWSFHDNLREIIRLINKQNEEKDIEKIKLNLPFLLDGIERLMGVEDMRLFPNAMQLLTKEDWEEFYEGDEEIGWMLKEKPTPYPEREEVYVHPSQDKKERKLSFSLEDTFHYDEGYMTPDQVNLLLRFLPVDITYVDENDKVIFYNRGEDRVFPRSKGIIGREVKFCHPPKSVHMVLRIVEEFRAGTKDLAEFWINFKGRMIHIRYFAIRDKEKKYRGVIEMSQDVTDIQKLEGQKRLLDWD